MKGKGVANISWGLLSASIGQKKSYLAVFALSVQLRHTILENL